MRCVASAIALKKTRFLCEETFGAVLDFASNIYGLHLKIIKQKLQPLNYFLCLFCKYERNSEFVSNISGEEGADFA